MNTHEVKNWQLIGSRDSGFGAVPWGHLDVDVGGAERGLPSDVPATEGEDLEVAGEHVEFNSDQPVRPVAIGADRASQQVNGPGLVGAAQKDDLSLSRAVRDGFWESPLRGSGIDAGGVFGAMGLDKPGGAAGQGWY